MIYFATLNSVVNSFSTFLSLTLLAVTLVLGALSIRNKYSSGQDSQTIESLKNSISAFETERKAHQMQSDSKKREMEAIYEQNRLLVQKADTLENQVTQAPQINELAVQLATQHKEMMKISKDTMQAIQGMTQELGNVAKAVVKEQHAS